MRHWPLIGTSWKMHLTVSEADLWFCTIVPLVADLDQRQLFVLPPFTALSLARERLAGTAIGWGAQDVSPDEDGAHTGDISAHMLADLGCDFVEVGHSERRRDHAETFELVARKVAAIVRWGMRPVLCVGETDPALSDTVTGLLTADLARCLAQVATSAAPRIVVAYEPVWAIGDGASVAPPDHVATVHAALHEWLEDWSGGTPVPVIYGGSVDEREAGQLLALPGVDGLFIGRHGLDPVEFARIARVGVAPHAAVAAGRQGGEG
jgi:triosephosphate isomerase